MTIPESHNLKHPRFLHSLFGPKRGAEVGVERGYFTEYMLNAFPALHMYAVDIWAVREPQEREGFLTYDDWPLAEIEADFKQRTKPFGKRVTVLKMPSVEAARLVPDGSLDFVFIDAEHTYEDVMEDIFAWRHKVAPGGYLCGHDYSKNYPGVRRAVDEIFPAAEVDRNSSVWRVRL